jgi:microcystin-dependent protein
LAPKASPAFTGTPTAPTAAGGTNTTQLATTAFTNAAIASALPGALPVGLIALWSGSIVSIPTGWTLCDGTAGTPDLCDRFVVGAGSTYAVNATGGVNTVTLTTAQMPSHTHTNSVSTTNLAHTHSGTTDSVDLSHTHAVSGNTGNQSANHNHGYSGTTDSAGTHAHDIYADDLLGAGGGLNPDAVFPPTGGVPVGITRTAGAHSHTYSGSTGNVSANHNHAISLTSGAMSANSTHTHTFTTGAMSANATHSHTVTINSAGSSAAHENRPPYFALAYIMKI